MMLIANVIYSPNDGGWYATVWNADNGHTVETMPPGAAVFDTEQDCVTAVHERFGSDIRCEIDA